jgi:hypothetical protein
MGDNINIDNFISNASERTWRWVWGSEGGDSEEYILVGCVARGKSYVSEQHIASIFMAEK